MDRTRRRLLRLIPAGFLASAGASHSLLAATGPRRAREAVALLVPLTGPQAALGLSMSRAFALVQGDPKDRPLLVLDTAPGAAAAAQLAVKRGARLIVGPLAAADVRPVLAVVAGRAPVVALSNDESLLDSGAFLLGITASQSADALLRYARSRGIRRVALASESDGWAVQLAAAARRLQGEAGVEIVASLDQADALLAPGGGEALLAAARAAQAAGVQLLATVQALDQPASAIAGAWIAAPDPGPGQAFADRYVAANGGQPGAIAALAYDAATVVAALRATGQLDRAGLLALPPVPTTSGALRFRTDGSVGRQLAILVAGADGWTVVGAGD